VCAIIVTIPERWGALTDALYTINEKPTILPTAEKMMILAKKPATVRGGRAF